MGCLASALTAVFSEELPAHTHTHTPSLSPPFPHAQAVAFVVWNGIYQGVDDIYTQASLSFSTLFRKSLSVCVEAGRGACQ